MKRMSFTKALVSPKATAAANAAQIGGAGAAGLTYAANSRRQRVKKKSSCGGMCGKSGH